MHELALACSLVEEAEKGLFATAKLALLTKMDLTDALNGDLKACQRSIQSVHPGLMTLKLSAKTGDGMDAWVDDQASLT